MSARRFLVLHGWENHRPVEHWQWWLVDRLRADGQQVLYPQRPSPDEPRLAQWLDALVSEWTQIAEFHVAPDDKVREAVAASSRDRPRLVASDVDVYFPEGLASELYRRPPDLDCDTVPGAGNATIEDGYRPWPPAHAWCLDPSTRFTPR